MGNKIDVAILTVLQEEYDAICSKFIDLQRWLGDKGSPNIYAWQVGTVNFPTQSCSYSVAVGMTGGAGNSQSTAATLEAIQLWQPRYILFVGVAGGLSGMAKGDIVIADVIHGYEYGKIADGFITRDDWTFPTDIGLRNGATDYTSNSDWRKLIRLTSPELCNTKVEVGNIASGDKVVDNPADAFFQKVQDAYSKAKAVEMEGAGVGHAIEQARARGKGIGFLMVRGISDIPRPKGEKGEIKGTQERDNWKPYASEAAAAFTIGYIASGLPELPVHQDKLTDIVPREIPSPPLDFTGREDELRDLLTHFDKGVTITGLCGMPGVGKTALAYKLAEILRDRYPDGQVKVDLQGTSEKPLTPTKAVAQIIHSFYPEARLPRSEAELVNRYASIVNSKRFLLMLDNATNDRQVRPLLPPKTCGVIVTSRNKFTLPGSEKLDLNTIKPDKAVELLLKIYGSTRSSSNQQQQKKDWNEIASLCGFLPLALRAAGSLLANTQDLSPRQYAKELLEERTRLEHLGGEGVDLDVKASFNLSHSRLSSDTARVFHEISIFPFDFDAKAEEVVCKDEGHQCLREMVKWSLVDFIPPSSSDEDGRYHLHDLTRIFAASFLDSVACISAQQRHAEYYLKVLTSANELYKRGGQNTMRGLKLFDQEWANIRDGRLRLKQMTAIESDEEIPAQSKNFVEFAWHLLNEYPNAGVRILGLRLHPQDWISWLETGLAAARHLKDRRSEAVHLDNLGNANAALSKTHQSIEHYKLALTIQREIGNRRGESIVLGNLGNAYFSLSEIQKAIEYHESALRICCEIKDHKGEGAILGNMGNAYSALGETRKAIDYFGQHLTIARESGDRRGEANAIVNLGRAHIDLGENRRGIECCKQALAIYQEIGDRLGEGNVLGNLGIAYKNEGDIQQAIHYYELQLDISRKIGDRRGEGNTLGNLGNAHENLGKHSLAIDLHNQALEISREIDDRPANSPRKTASILPA